MPDIIADISAGVTIIADVNGMTYQSVAAELAGLDTRLDALEADDTTKTYVDAQDALKADKADTYTKTEVDAKDATKADKTAVEAGLALKADKAEIEAARGTEPTLGARLDSTDAQLASTPKIITVEVTEPNEIPKATTATDLNAFLAASSNSILKGYRSVAAGALEAHADYDCLKVFLSPGSVVRSKMIFRGLPSTSNGILYYVAFFRRDGTNPIKTIKWYNNASPNISTLIADGVVAPTLTKYAYINIFNKYYYDDDVTIGTNGKESEIITINKPESLTSQTPITTAVPDYIAVEEGTHLELDKDIRIQRYDNQIGDIQAVLATVVEVV